MILTLLLFSNIKQGHAQNHNDCNNKILSTYADSLNRLITKFQPNNIIRLSDSLSSIHQGSDCPKMISILASRAFAYEQLYKFEKAIEVYDDILQTAIDKKYTEEEINIRIGLARVYEIIGKPELCKQYLDEIKNIFLTYEDKSLESHYYVRRASYLRIYKDLAEAKEYALQAIELGEESGRLTSISDGYLILGIITRDPDEALAYFQESAHYCYQDSNYNCYLFQTMNVAKKYNEKENYKESLKILYKIEPEIDILIDSRKNYLYLLQYHSNLKAFAYEGIGQKDSVITSLKKESQYSKLFGDVTNEEKITQLLLDNALEKEKAKVTVANNMNKSLTTGLGLLGGATVILLGLFFSNISKNKKIQQQSSTIKTQYNEMESLYHYQSTLLSEVHHRIKNNLQLIISLLTLQQAKLGNNIDGDILKMLNYRISSISLIHEQLYNLKEFEKVNVALYAQDLINNFNGLIQDRKVHITSNIKGLSLNIETIIPLGLIWSELISNSIKYNFDKEYLKIYFELIKDRDNYVMKYRDNGSGYKDGKFSDNRKGMGYTIINSLSRQLSAEPRTFNSDGANFTLTFKQKRISSL